jgi:endonuclease/exonuclease/phosphatase family metal-dependent hydrolase
LAGELVLSPEDVARLAIGRQFARTPYIVSFLTAGTPVTLATVHVIWGDDPAQRAKEAAALGELLKLVVHDPSPATPDDFRRNLIALGDFNISRTGDAGYQALLENGLTPDPELADLPRTVGEEPGKTTAYDQMAWISRGNEGALGLDRTASGTIAWPDLIQLDPAHGDPTYRISDHYPLWVEFALPLR